MGKFKAREVTIFQGKFFLDMLSKMHKKQHTTVVQTSLPEIKSNKFDTFVRT